MPPPSSVMLHVKSRSFSSGNMIAFWFYTLKVFVTCFWNHWCCFTRNKAALDETVQGLRKDCEDTIDSQTDNGGCGQISSDIEHIILPQVQYIQ